MRNLIRKRLTEYRIDALDNVAVAVNNTKANFAKHGALNSERFYLFINEHNKTGFAQYLDRSANFIRYVAGLSASQYADELRDAANDLKYEIMAKMDVITSCSGRFLEIQNGINRGTNLNQRLTNSSNVSSKILGLA
jgi:hypothetical protein